MLVSYRFKNFQSFREQGEVTLVLNKKIPEKGWEAMSSSGQRLSTAMAILGANGAGKTAALKPLAFAHWFMLASFSASPDIPIPVEPHFSSESSPTEIEIEADDAQGVVWKYVLHVTRDRVVHEALYRKNIGFKYVFIRDWNEESSSYKVKQQGFGLTPAEARKVRPNASLISTALQYGVELAKHLASFWLVTNVNVAGRDHFRHSMILDTAKRLYEDKDVRAQVVKLLTEWDLGLKDIEIKEVELADENNAPVKVWLPLGIHQGRGGHLHALRMDLESSGTQSAFVLLPKLITVLKFGGVALIDELESDLHPHMLEPILALFANQSTNPHAAQLIFTCHTMEVLDLLQKSQVTFVEKTLCESEVYRGDEIQGLRADDNLRAKYLAGALGAVPII